jgi:hypothetical protein
MQTDDKSPTTDNGQQTTGLLTLDQLRASEQRYLARRRGDTGPKPLTEAARAYIQRMQAAEQEAGDTSIGSMMGCVSRRGPARPFIPYPYTCEEAYPLALTVYRSRLAAVGRQLHWESDTEMVFHDLVRYFIGDTEGCYDVHRGIYLFGDFGVGKTLLMKSFQEFAMLIEERLARADVPFTPRTFRFNHCRDIAMEIQRTAGTESLKQYFTGTRLFDDMGNEEEKKIYGNDVNAMAEILLTRYNAYQYGGPVTHCTSNLPPHECQELYGDRIGSRVFELFNHVYLDGSDKRVNRE